MKSSTRTPAVNGFRHARVTKGAESELQVPALERGLAVLELVASTPAGLTLAEINVALKISPASGFRIATALEELGYVQRDAATKRFRLTHKLLLLGQPRTAGRSLVQAALEPMRRALHATGETTQLCCLAEDTCVIIEQLPSLHPFKYFVDLGSRAPLHCAAPGKALLAFLPESERAEVLGRLRLERHTNRTLASRKALSEELERVRALGYAVDFGEHFEAIHCVAAPLLDRHGHAVAAITIAGPKERIPQSRFAELGQVMQEAANDAARQFAS
ncbi:MAG: Transcriptional regulator IclR family [Limisphaerales bacterium]|nr:MAG: Transcriptional regulator IclR family [Limisphaerales bacterium]KAG0507435.1 MAG: Transcriptional regulator IclR family [Limisphaerales bacterium]TXT51446.1 MAG: Transcriptional regulator IclR family [Limisphaerales bacterium]